MTPSSSAHGVLITSRSRCSKTRFRDAGRRRSRSRRRPEGLPRRSGTARRSSRSSRRRRARSRPCTCCRQARGAEPRSRISSVTCSCRVRLGLEPDVGHFDLACVEPARGDDEADLAPVEGDRRVGLHRRARDLARRRVDSARHVHGEDRDAEAVEFVDRARRVVARLAGEAGAEERVHRHVRRHPARRTGSPAFVRVRGSRRRRRRPSPRVPRARSRQSCRLRGACARRRTRRRRWNPSRTRPPRVFASG